MSKYSEAGKGSTNKLKQKKAFDNGYDNIKWEKEEETESTWDEDRMDIIGINGNTGDHYIK